MTEGFDHIFLDPQPKPAEPSTDDPQKPSEVKPEEDYYDYDGPVFPKLNPLQITLIVLTLLMLIGFGVFYVHRTSAQKNDSSSSSLTPIPTEVPTDTPVVIPSQTTDIPNTTTKTVPQTEGGLSLNPTATPTPTITQPTPTNTSAPPTPTNTSTQPTPTDTVPPATPTPTQPTPTTP